MSWEKERKKENKKWEQASKPSDDAIRACDRGKLRNEIVEKLKEER